MRMSYPIKTQTQLSNYQIQYDIKKFKSSINCFWKFKPLLIESKVNYHLVNI
jgi:hypothetical protein